VERGSFASIEDSHQNRLLKQKSLFVGEQTSTSRLLEILIQTSRNMPPTPVQSNNWFRGHFWMGQNGRKSATISAKSVQEMKTPYS
jgi:hypothetical protein